MKGDLNKYLTAKQMLKVETTCSPDCNYHSFISLEQSKSLYDKQRNTDIFFSIYIQHALSDTLTTKTS